MTHLRMTEHFEVPIEHLFDLAIDFKRYPEWNVSYVEVKEIVGEPDRVGTKVHSLMKVLGRQVEAWGEIIEIERPRLLKMTGKNPDGSFMTTTQRASPAGTGTDVEIEIDYELPPGIVGQIADKIFVERAVERDLHHSVENFKAFVEAKVPVLA